MAHMLALYRMWLVLYPSKLKLIGSLLSRQSRLDLPPTKFGNLLLLVGLRSTWSLHLIMLLLLLGWLLETGMTLFCLQMSGSSFRLALLDAYKIFQDLKISKRLFLSLIVSMPVTSFWVIILTPTGIIAEIIKIWKN
ncbi:hypothetical protein CASFOL_002169 [Castilleja foliolosa]|uniref:Uncharacterized protein n=1 Tax=Castilleja foliolosa TaxID=1961234 RepID=A0ABD3EDT4_9LAMI